MRPSGRQLNELRKIEIEAGISKHAEGSCFVKFGDTHVLCTASVENRVPPWLSRSLRAVIDLKLLGEFQISVDCDVIQADGGTRTASITGAWVALRQSVDSLLDSGDVKKDPIKGCVGAVSCGIYRNNAVLDLDYAEDSVAEADANFVLTDKGGVVEIQATAETSPFSEKKFNELLVLAQKGVQEINNIQKEIFS